MSSQPVATWEACLLGLVTTYVALCKLLFAADLLDLCGLFMCLLVRNTMSASVCPTALVCLLCIIANVSVLVGGGVCIVC